MSSSGCTNAMAREAPVQRAARCNFLEVEGEPLVMTEGQVEIPYLPFQIITAKIL